MYALESKNIDPITSIEHVVYSINVKHRMQDTRVNQVIVMLLDQVDKFTCEYNACECNVAFERYVPFPLFS